MASVTEKPKPDTPPQPVQRAEKLLVDQQIGRTRRALKIVDLTAGLITLTIGVLAFLLTMAVLEHWVIPGGWSDVARGLLFGLLILGIAWYCWQTFWPLLRQPINPAFAAQAIEQSSPSLKNSLLNLLLLRTHQRRMSRQVFQAIEQQAAQGLSQVQMESVVDRSIILRLGYILVALTAICALYRFFSPKDLFTSAGRVLMPWSTIATPSRVEILNVTPGDAKAARGEQLEITAEVLGLEADEPVRLLYSTVDEQIVGQKILMTASAGGSLFSCQVPGRVGVGSSGIQQDFSYWIEAGDARSPRYRVGVYARPTMVVNRLRYEYPAYTGYPSREVEHTGDISAVEGTKVTLQAQANKLIKAAHVDFEADGRRDLLMNANEQQATVTFPLELRDDRRTPRHQSYVLRYVTTDGNQNEQPPKYQIDVQPDYSPEIQLLLPEEPMLEVALNQEVNFELEARDPDFALSQVILIGKVGEEQRLQEDLLTRSHTGRFVGKLRKTPEQLGLKVGDVLEYWGAAADNRRPDANLAYSAHRKLRVVGPWQGEQGGEKGEQGKGEKQQGEGGDSQEGEDGKQEGQAGGGEQGNSGEGEEGNEGGESGDGQESGEQGENNNSQGQAGESASADGQNQAGEPTGTDGNQGESSPEGEGGEASEDPAAGGGGGEQGKVSPEGDDDGSAFERMAEHFKDQLGDSEGDANESGENQPGAGKGADGENSAKSDGNAADGNAADGSADENQEGESGESDAQEGDQSAGQEGAKHDRESDAEGAKGEPAATEEEKQGGEEQGAEAGEQQDGQSPDGDMSKEQGEAGAGDSDGEQQGTPNPSGANRPKDKQGDQADSTERKKSEAPSNGEEQTESDSEGGQGGDKSGGGKEGAGQQADADGKGGAGEHQAADEGAGQASETGEGETGERPGDQKPAEGKTGESDGDQKGGGSKQGEQAGEQSGGKSAAEGQDGQPGAEPSAEKPGEKSNQQPNQQQPKQQQPLPGESASADGQAQAGEPSGTGGKPSSPPPGGETQPGDDANLDYARKQTDLILDRLEDQLKKKEVDKSLLEKLGWSQDELRRFVDRWKNLKNQIEDKSGSTDANQELNDALRSLGLGPKRRTGFQSKLTKDKLRDLQEAWRGRVPLEYQEQIRSYNKGVATAQENE